ncbi:bifunctional lysylphosphatidylglycerol flippase/synthetase MprF [Oharaeibacter diazotrophicus]|uniref:Phosphatidylglycerol lysyltransferase n=1 Tax=Oharaeibacter diazotrophicus TaxID=1920512 RepID=A0A4R6RJY0_9HYPH|nr:bifunctional lysylphosphatidylglycerol flippase/synthetase MprF [Oharaeibacter diazotrophicus]TDP86415.1 phosphatidylglycerol lysyltransferase [Oharaeibacter diazotrophicus]BBE71642.1 phosphatidylglycerol lysyltransferase [Pleomorphomonas sp. SM30]GLS78407.1 hypothetical protein GCM10007904_37440 [Oharaeibacter diazotrophicus]
MDRDSPTVAADGADRWAVWRGRLLIAAALAAVALSVFALNKLLQEVDYQDLATAIVATPWSAVAIAGVFTAVSFLALSVYDRLALAFVGRELPPLQVALASFCAYAVGNVAGFGPLTGGTVRYRFYAPLGVEPEEIARIVGYVTVAFGIGLGFVGSLGILFADRGIAHVAGLPPVVFRIAAVVILGAIAALIAAAAVGDGHVVLFGRRIALPRPREILIQLGATTVDIAASAAVLWILLPAGPVSYPLVLSIYAVAIGLGILSHVPGGVGVFEATVVAGLGGRLPVEGVLGALLLYRVIYYAAPLALAVAALTVTEVRRAAGSNPLIGRATGAMVPLVLGTMAVLLGAMLVFSGATPAPDEKLDWLQQVFPLPLVEGAHFLASVLGIFLIVAARGLVHRLDGAWWFSVFVLALSIPLALVKALAIGEALLLAVLLVALLTTRPIFNRPASLIHDRLSPGWWLCVATVLAVEVAILFFVYKEVDYSHELWWQFEFQAAAPRSLRAALGIALAAAGAAAFLLTRPPTGRPERPSEDDVERAAVIVRGQPVADASLVMVGDKSVMFSDDGSAFVMYGKRGRSWVALLDPIGGTPAARAELVWRFVETARRHGGRAVFYQVPAESLALYADAGLSAFKLGEEARIRLADFTLKGSRRSSFRNAINKAERDGITFSIVPKGEVAAVMPQLQAISDAWLDAHAVREKGFSLGSFEPDYVARTDVALLRRGEEVLAFANLLTTDLKEEATIDLMRFAPGAPNGAMEVLFAKILLHFQAEGYAWFSLGMAPLSGLSENPVAPLWHRVGRAAFDHGEAFYNFHGLRAFKSKFDPIWTPRYMAVAGGLNPVLALADVTVLISGGLKGVIAK